VTALSILQKLTKDKSEELAAIDKLCNPPGWSANLFRSEIDLAHSLQFGIFEDGKLIAFIVAQCVVDRAEILNLAVLPEFQKRGVASQLIVKIEELAALRGARELTLEVRASNIRAQNLYNKFGFKKVGLRKKYYEDNAEDAILMTKNLG
jgi:ribosomal-protein-alanine N-acetyltransferase